MLLNQSLKTTNKETMTAAVQSKVDTSSSTKSTVGVTSSKALQYLLKEDPLLQSLKLTSLSSSNEASSSPSEPPAFSYAAALIKTDEDGDDDNGNGDLTYSSNIQQKAQEALAEVDRKLALVESLSERISREKPEHVAAPLMKLHGYNIFPSNNDKDGSSSSSSSSNNVLSGSGNNTTISSTMERCDRLKRQAQVLDSVANRVESTLVRGLDRMSLATGKLERVLKTSQVLKMIMRLRFEAKKVMGSGLDFDALETNPLSSTSAYVDLRDLTRAAASVSVMEELLNHEDLKDRGIEIVEQMRPEAERVARAVRKAAAGILAEQHNSSSNALVSATKLGATLQVYYHLGELPDAAWNAVCLGLEKAEAAHEEFLNPSAVKTLVENAKSEAKKLADEEIRSSGVTDKKQKEIIHERTLKKKMRESKAKAATAWATGVSGAALQVWNLHRVLSRKSDPVTREKFLDVVNAAPIPEMFDQAQALLGIGLRQRDQGQKKASIFALFWNQMCISVGRQIAKLLKHDNGALVSDVATFYPAVRSAALEMLNYIQDTMQAGSLSASTSMIDDINSGTDVSCGIMGGSAVLDDAIFFGWGNDAMATANLGGLRTETEEIGGSGFGSVSADTWTRPESNSSEKNNSGFDGLRSTSTTQTSSALSSILSSPEWFALQGSGDIGLYPMQRAFLKASKERLNAPLKKMFVENHVVDENGIDIKMLSSLPSAKDLKKLENCLHDELCIADPREGGGEFNMTTMMSENIVDLVENFCDLAKGATSGVPEEKMLHDEGTATEELLHDMKVAAVMVRKSMK